MDQRRIGSTTVYVARVLVTLALIALVGAWITQLTGRTLLGMSQQHLFSDAIALSLLGIAGFLDAFWHQRHA